MRGLLEANGVPSVITSDVPHNIFPLTVNGLGEVRLSVRRTTRTTRAASSRATATELQSGQLVRLRDEFEALQAAVGYRFRDRGLLEHAMTHTLARQRGRERRRHRQRVARVPRRRRARLRHGRSAVPRVPRVRRGREVEDEGHPGLDGDARAPGRAARPRRSPAARARRGEDGRAPQAGPAGRRLRGAHRRAVPRRWHRAGAGVHRARARGASSRNCGATACRPRITSRRSRSWCRDAIARCPSTASSGPSAPIIRSCSTCEVLVAGEPLARATGPSKKEAEQEAARIALTQLAPEK